MTAPTKAEAEADLAQRTAAQHLPQLPAKPKLEDTAFFQLHRILDSRPRDSALRVDRKILEGMMVEIISAAKRVEKLQKAALALSPALDFTKDDSPQDTIFSLLKEARDNIVDTISEDGPSDKRVKNRIDLAERITKVIGVEA